MKIAFTAKGTHWQSQIDPRLGRTEFIGIFDEETNLLDFVDNRLSGNDGHGAGTKTAQILFDLNPDVLITGNGPGSNAASILSKLNIEIYTGAGDMTLKEAYDKYKAETLSRYNF